MSGSGSLAPSRAPARQGRGGGQEARSCIKLAADASKGDPARQPGLGDGTAGSGSRQPSFAERRLSKY